VLEGLTPNKRIYECRVLVVRSELDDSDRKILDDALADEKTWSAYALSKALIGRGIIVQDKAIKKHRDGLCICSRE